jgi:hypothetical protein
MRISIMGTTQIELGYNEHVVMTCVSKSTMNFQILFLTPKIRNTT